MARLSENGKWIGAKSNSGDNEKIQMYFTSIAMVVGVNIFALVAFLIAKFVFKVEVGGLYAAILSVCWILVIIGTFKKGILRWLTMLDFLLTLLPYFIYCYIVGQIIKQDFTSIFESNVIIFSLLHILGSATAIAFCYYRIRKIEGDDIDKKIVIGVSIFILLSLFVLIIEGTITLEGFLVIIAPILITIMIVTVSCLLIGIILYFILKKKLQDKSNPKNINMDGSFVHTDKKIKSISISVVLGLLIIALLIIFVPKIYNNYVNSDTYKTTLKNEKIANEKTKEQDKEDAILKYRGLKGTENKAEYVKIGTYEQDNNINNGKEGIEWLVLEKKKDRILVMSKQGIDINAFNDTEFAVWEKSSIRKWLNEEFINCAFADNEKSQIIESKIKPDKDYLIFEKEKTTKDKIFLISLSEYYKYMFADEISCVPTQYVNNKYTDLLEDKKIPISANTFSGINSWWLRTQGVDYNIKGIKAHAPAFQDFITINTKYYNAIRPAMWIKTNKINFEFLTDPTNY